MAKVKLFQAYFDTLITGQAWPKPNGSRRLYIFKAVCVYCIFPFPLFTGIFMHFYKMCVESYSFFHILGGMSVGVTALTDLLMVLTFLARYDVIVKLVDDFETYEIYRPPKNLLKRNDLLNILFNIYKWFIRFGTTAAVLERYAFRKHCETNYREKGIDDICGLYLELYYPFKIDYSPVLEIFAFYELFILTLFVENGSALGSALFSMLEVINLKLDDLKSLISETVDFNNDYERHHHMKFCVAYHHHILQLLDDVLNGYSTIIFSAIFPISLIIAVGLFDFLLTRDVRSIIVSTAWVAIVFTACFIGQRLMEKSREIGDAVYELPWYEFDKTTSMFVLFIIMRAQKPLRFTAGPFFDFSADMLKQIASRAYSVLALLYGYIDNL